MDSAVEDPLNNILSTSDFVGFFIIYHQPLVFVVSLCVLLFIFMSSCNIISQLEKAIFLFAFNFMIHASCLLYAGYRFFFLNDKTAISFDSSNLRLEIQICAIVCIISFFLHFRSRRKDRKKYTFYFVYFIFVGNALLALASKNLKSEISVISIASFTYLIAVFFYISFVLGILSQLKTKADEIESEIIVIESEFATYDTMVKNMNFESISFSSKVFKMLKKNICDEFSGNDPVLMIDIEMAIGFFSQMSPKDGCVGILSKSFSELEAARNGIVDSRKLSMSNIFFFLLEAFEESDFSKELIAFEAAVRSINDLNESFVQHIESVRKSIPEYLWKSIEKEEKEENKELEKIL